MVRNYAYADLFLRNDVQKDLIITDGIVTVEGGHFVYNNYTYLLTNDDLKSVPKIYEMLTDEKSLDFGRCNSNYIEFSIAADVIKLIGKKCRVYMYLDNRVETIFKVGVYYITSDKATADRNYRNIVAYDKLKEMKEADVTDWYNSLFPNDDSVISVGAMRSSFCQHFNVLDATDTSEMVNDAVTCGKNISAGDGGMIDGDTILRAMCSANGGFGNMDRDGKFRTICLPQGLIGLYPAIDLYPSEDLYPSQDKTTLISQAYYIPPLDYEDYYTENITKVCIRDDDDSVGVTVGAEGNDYILEGNFIFFNKTSEELTEIATRLLGRIQNLCYMPYSVRAFGNPCYEVGDAVRFRTGDVRVNSYILKRTLTGTIALEDEYQSVGNQYRDDKAGDLSVSVQKLINRTAKIKKDVDGVSVELEDFENDTETEFSVIQGQINLKVSTGEFNSAISNLGNQISMKVSQGDVGSSLSLESGQVTLSSNRLIVDSTNFKLDGSGNAKFSGTLEGATIKSGTTITAYNSDSSHWTSLGSDGLWIKESGSGQNSVDIMPQNIYLREPSYASNYVWAYVDSVTHRSQLLLSGNGGSIYLQSNGSIGAGSNTIALTGGGLTFNGNYVLTTVSTLDASKLSGTIPSSVGITFPDDPKVSQIKNTSGTARINIDYGSSAYNIVLNGSVNIGNGSSNAIRIKGHDVKWVRETINGTSYLVLVEDA